MKTFGRTNSVVDSVASAAGSVRHQRDEGLASLNQKGAEVSVWLDQLFKLYKNQLMEMAPCRDDDALANSHEAGSEDDDSLPQDVIAWIDSLKKKELVKELRGRELNTTGLKDDLRERLIHAMLDDRRKAAAKEEAAAASAKNLEPVEKVVQHMESMDISVEKSLPPVAKSKSSNDEDEDKKMEDVGSIVQNEASDPMEVEPTDEFTMQHQQNKPETSSALKRVKPAGIENDRPAVKLSADNEKSTTQPKSPGRTSRSPLRRMQSTVQSALRNLRPVSPKKVTDEPQKSPKPKKQIVVLPQTLSTDETEASNSSQSEVAITSTAAPRPAPIVPVPGFARPHHKTPATACSSSSTTISKLGGLGIHSEKTKANASARMARIAEMRNKSKQVTSSSSKTGHAMHPFGGPKATTGANSTAANNKRQLLASQMREKARLGEAATTHNPTVVAPSKAAPSQQASLASLTTTLKKDTPPPAKPTRSPVLSPLDTYDMSDHDRSSDTDEEEERARRVGKRVPNWAHSKQLNRALAKQYTDKSVDPEELFGEVDTCNLEDIFGRKKTKYQRRTSSGNWTRDKATVAEKLAFKRQMGFAVQA